MEIKLKISLFVLGLFTLITFSSRLSLADEPFRYVLPLSSASCLVAQVSFPNGIPQYAQEWVCDPGYGDCGQGCGSIEHACCPDGYPHLSLCDCRCYETIPQDCSSWVVCGGPVG